MLIKVTNTSYSFIFLNVSLLLVYLYKNKVRREIGCHVQSKETEAQKGQKLASFQGRNTIPHFTQGNPFFSNALTVAETEQFEWGKLVLLVRCYHC